MALIHSLEKNGNFLFRYRGQFPILLFLLAVPVIYFTDYKLLNQNETLNYIYLGLSIFISFLGQYIRAVAIGTSQKATSGRNKYEQIAEALNTKGIYSTLRHPLYLGNYFMWLGIIMFTFNIWFIVSFTLLFWVYYERIMFAEERFLERKFGQMYIDWSLKVPAFIPSFKNYEKTEIPFSFKTILRREYSGISATIISFLFIDFFKRLFELKEVKFELYQGIILAIAILYSLILRTLKHKTKILFEEDRS
ncbi:MAG: methyltransferase family protein [Flavobacteriia bacterium]|jgi:protein-S-isoprenylcysteine O-methyltransferase Ste14